jgi:hypothetical protein
MNAVRNDRVFAYSDERMDRMGPSVLAAAASLCELIDRARAPAGTH